MGWIERRRRRTQPQGAVRLAPDYPWDVFVAPASAPNDIAYGASNWLNRNAVISYGIDASPGGTGMPLGVGVGGSMVSAIPRGGKIVCTGVVALYLAPGSAAGSIHLGFSGGMGFGQTTLAAAADGHIEITAPNEDWAAAANIVLPGDRRGQVICAAMSGGRGTGDATISVRAAIDGLYAGSAPSLGATRVNGTELCINPGNGYQGMSGVLLYAGYWWGNELASPETLAALSRLWAPFAPRRRRIPTSAAAPAVPDITFVGAENITSNSVGYRVTLNYA